MGAAQVATALRTAAECMDPPALLERLLPYAAHKNPKVQHSLHLYFLTSLVACGG